MHLTTPRQLKKSLPLSPAQQNFIQESRQTIQRILTGKDERLLIIAGPCSIHDTSACEEFAIAFKELSEKVSSSCFLVMRAYVEKPRTQSGWKGLLHDPFFDGTAAIEDGLFMARQFLLKLAELELPAACEFVTPELSPYFQDLISWGCIGARTVTSQPHRVFASSLPMPVGFKNSIEGNIDSAIQAVMTAREKHAYVQIDEDGRLSRFESSGNPFGHIVLRGSHSHPNCDPQSVSEALTKLRRSELPARLIIDCSHGNCQKRFDKQIEAFNTALEQIAAGVHISGLMIESHLEEGTQPHDATLLRRGVSITDPCLSFSALEQLVLSSTVNQKLLC